MIDVKKFVVAFLILAALASSSAIFLSGIINNSPSATASQKAFTATSFGNSPIQTNAFAPASAQVSPNNGVAALASDPANVTNHLADSLLTNFVAANPSGPRDDGQGNKVITTPTVQSVLDDANTNSALSNVQIPDWDFDAARITTRVATSSSDSDVSHYSDALNGITNTYLVKTNVQSIVENKSGGTPENIALVSTQIGNALVSVGGLTVPSNLVDFHKSLVKILVYEKNALALTQNASADPAKAALIFQAETAKYNTALQEFQNALQKASQNKAFGFAPPKADERKGLLGFFKNILGIPTAHAQWIVFDPTTFAQMIWQFLQSVLLQILKNTIIPLLQNKVLSLIQNAGDPKFIQNWSGLIATAFQGSAGSALGQITPGLCSNFNTDVTGWLKNVYTTSAITPGGVSLNGSPNTNCTLQNVVPNIPGYYNDFNTAGWDGFGALLNPRNNPFGAFAEAYDSVSAVAGAESAAAQAKGTAASGYKGQEVCSNGKPPDDKIGNICPNGLAPFVTTPGTTFADTVGRNLNSSIDLIVNANDITGLIGAIAGSLLQQVISSGVNGLIGASQAQNNQGPPPPPQPVACHNSQTVASVSQQVFFSATGGKTSNYAWSSVGGNPNTGSGQSFATTYTVPGGYTATVTNVDPINGNTSASCSITIQ